MKLLDKMRAWIKLKWEELDENPDWLLSREEWGAEPPRMDMPLQVQVINKPEYLPWPLKYVVIHSTLGFADPGDDHEQILKTIHDIQDDDMFDKNWDDIGYNFLIGGDGLVYEGTGWKQEGSHCYECNANSIGVAFIGDFRDKPPKRKMITAARLLIEEGMKKGYLRGNVRVVTHAQLTEGALCPAKYLLEEVEIHKSLEPDINWSEYFWLYSCKRWLDDAPEMLKEIYKRESRDLRLRWRFSFIRSFLMYIWHN